MKRFLLLILLLPAISSAAQSPEELYGEFITPETRAIMERFEEAERRAQEAEVAAKARKTLALSVAILIGLIPLGVIGRRILREKSWKGNPSGTAKAIGTALAGGAVLFGLNYGIFLLKMRYGDAFNTTLAFLLVAAMIAGSIYLLQKK
ncbi:MAG: hypothetical protein J6Y31_04960 [Bacteroidales bacterium]|nr:hypothetical protein [Bacteroidales bacterium]